MTDPDSDALALAERGDTTEALRALVARHAGAIYRFCCEQLRDSTLAEDVQQQVFLDVFRNLHRFQGRSTFRTWLFAVARHRVLDAVKAQRRQQTRHTSIDVLERAADVSPSAAEELDDRRLQNELHRCISNLPEGAKEALILHYQHGFTFEQIATMAHLKPSTVQARVRRAMPVLRREIESRLSRAYATNEFDSRDDKSA